MAQKLKDNNKWSLSSLIKSCDFYRVMPRELTESSMTGASISFIAMTILMLLFVTEFAKFLTIETKNELVIADVTNIKNNKLNMVLDIYIQQVPCELLTISVFDVMGTKEEDILNNEYPGAESIKRYRVIHNQMMPFENNLSYDIKNVADHIKEHQGCRIEGHISINTNGKFKDLALAAIATGYKIDFTHRINRLQFGEDNEELEYLKKRFSNDKSWSPFEGTIGQQPMFIGSLPFGFYSAYFMDVVPTQYIHPFSGKRFNNYLYSGSHQNMLYLGTSQIIFKFDLSSICVVYHHEKMPFLTFIVNLCAIIGGFITVTSIIDSLLRNLGHINKTSSMNKMEVQ